MFIFATEYSFAVAIGSKISYKWDKKSRGLLVWAGDGDFNHTTVETDRGQFIEAVDATGAIIKEGGDGHWFNLDLSAEPILLRHKTLPSLELPASRLAYARQTVTRWAYCDGPSALPATFSGVIAWMQERLAEIPAECRESARFRFGTTAEYGETSPEIEITYSQKESDEEVTRRIQIETERARLTEAADRKQLATLQKRYS